MNRVFSITAPFFVPDGTWVSPFLNVKGSHSDVPLDLLATAEQRADAMRRLSAIKRKKATP